MPQCNAYTDCDSDSYCYSYSDSHCNCNSHSYSYDDSEINAHGKTASNTCPSTVTAGVNETV